ncbi:MAG: hypothetical protein GWN93_27920, partial [Deltaproteobacteria bacterium]|nr:hypothetical protein [Deltaproteobacteria bacterium]
MPWTTADVDKHKKGLSAKAKETWVKVANKALASCRDKIDGEPSDEQVSRCEASAIKQANAVAGNMGESIGLPELSKTAIETALAVVNESYWLEIVAQDGESRQETATRLLTTLQEKIDAALVEAATTKTVSGRTHDRGDFLVVEDAEKPTTWHLPVKVRGKPDHRLMGGAWAALMSPSGHRGNKYEGPGKQEAVKKLRALYKAEDMETPEQSAEAAEAQEEGGVSPQQVRAVLKFLWTRFGAEEAQAPQPAPPAQGAEKAEAEADEVAEVELAESSSGAVIGLAEDIATAAAQSSIVPLKLNVGIIRPGWGNKKDGHYYPAETLRRDSAAVFPGIKMYESDHRDEEKSTRTWVSTVDEITGFTEDGAPIGRVVVHDEGFAKRLLALNEAGILNKMECSILGTGKVRKGEIDGRKGKIVEAITDARSVDWVTRGGAGGHALNLAESGGDSDMKE